MPEGDTIFRAARTLHRALAGKTVVRFESVLPALDRVHDDAPVTGRTIERVSTAGKHLLMHFSGDLVLRTHMRMNGSWHIYRPASGGSGRGATCACVVATDDFEAVGFNMPVAEFLTSRDLRATTICGSSVPICSATTFDAAEAVRRLRERGADMAIADALLNQRVMAGVGNVYKSEVLFLCGSTRSTRCAMSRRRS